MILMRETPLISFVVPCYNSAEYMRRGIDSILLDGDEPREHIEIILVNDGSTDDTEQIAREYEERHPSIVRVVSQENGGHGAAVMAGVRAAVGTYLKVLDSDDRLDARALTALLDAVASFPPDNRPDVVLTDYVYDNHALKKNRRIGYRRTVPARRTVTWDQVSRPRMGSYFLMHAILYKRSVLLESGLELPRHTFYVDNLYASIPLRHTHTLYYLPVPLYYYFIGREDQSVNEKIMISRLDQQLRVNRIMIDELRVENIASRSLRRYLLHYLTIITSVSLTFAVLAKTPEAKAQGRELLAYLKAHNYPAYRAYRRTPMSIGLSARGPGAHRFIRTTYGVIRKRFGFN
ncbi:glycosyltransferase [Dermabacter vaginalis]|nr:glycosyltransferase [Dermabacter vaginalis]